MMKIEKGKFYKTAHNGHAVTITSTKGPRKRYPVQGRVYTPGLYAERAVKFTWTIEGVWWQGEDNAIDLVEIKEEEWLKIFNTPPIDPGKWYRTRNGSPVVIHEHDLDNSYTFPVKGSIYKVGKGLHDDPEYCVWMPDGRFNAVQSWTLEGHNLKDLVEITEQEWQALVRVG